MKTEKALIVLGILAVATSIRAEKIEFLQDDKLGITPSVITDGELVFPALGAYGSLFKLEEVKPKVSN